MDAALWAGPWQGGVRDLRLKVAEVVRNLCVGVKFLCIHIQAMSSGQAGLGSKPILELARHLLPSPNARVPGSHGHPELCHRPCVHMQRFGSCLAGANCGYCHEQHDRPPWKVAKPLRRTLQRLERATLMDLLLNHIHRRVEEQQMLPEAQALLQSLENERCLERQPSYVEISRRDLYKLSKELSRLPLLALVAW